MIDICDKAADTLVDRSLEEARKGRSLEDIWEQIFFDVGGNTSIEIGFVAGLLASAITYAVNEEL